MASQELIYITGWSVWTGLRLIRRQEEVCYYQNYQYDGQRDDFELDQLVIIVIRSARSSCSAQANDLALDQHDHLVFDQHDKLTLPLISMIILPLISIMI